MLLRRCCGSLAALASDGVQNLGVSQDAVNVPSNTPATLYRVTAVGLAGQSRSVLESIYAKY